MTDLAPLTAPIDEVVASRLRDIPDFPVAGVTFKDFTPLLSDGPALRAVVQDISRRYSGQVDVVVGIEARGLILGAAVAYELGVGFVPIRKAGKLPGKTHSAKYDLEYGSAVIEVHSDAFTGGKRALVMDDVLATGGTARQPASWLSVPEQPWRRSRWCWSCASCTVAASSRVARYTPCCRCRAHRLLP